MKWMVILLMLGLTGIMLAGCNGAQSAESWLLNDGGRFMREKLIPTPIPQYDHHYSQSCDRPLCKYVYHINRDALFGDLFRHLAGDV